jgi:hypothetical protein
VQLSEFLSDADNPHSQAGNPGVACNALYKTKQNLNCYLTPTQAISLARHLLEKAQLLIDNEVEDAAVQLWNQGEQNEKLYLGLVNARKGPRKKKKAVVVADGLAPTPAAEPITRQRIDELLRFLPTLTNPGPDTVPEWHGLDQDPADGVFTMPYPTYPPVVEEFFSLAGQDWWCDFQYVSKQAGEMVRDDDAIRSASLHQIKTMLTFCVRGERFCDGHWGAMVGEGRIGAILRRLSQLRDDVPEADLGTSSADS